MGKLERIPTLRKSDLLLSELEMAKTRGGTTGASNLPGGVALRKHSKENIMAGTHVGGANRIVKAKLAVGSTQAKKATKSGVLSSVDNLAQQTRRLELKSGPKENLAREAKNPSTRNAPVKKSSTRRVKTEELVNETEEELVSVDFLPEGVSDIDEGEDRDNPQSAAEYVNHIYAHLRQLEEKYAVHKDFLRTTTITARMRSILINWLAQVSLQFKLLQETLYRFLSLNGSKLQYKTLQLVGVASMLIACKYEEMYVPEVNDFVFITDQAYEAKEILAKELEIMKALGFNLGKPIALNFLRRNSKAGYVDVKHHSLAKYILEESMTSYPLASVKPSEKAAGALLIALKILSPSSSLQALWSDNLWFYSAYTLSELSPTVKALAACLLQAPTSRYKAAYDKYNCSSRGYVSKIPEMHAELLQKFVSES